MTNPHLYQSHGEYSNNISRYPFLCLLVSQAVQQVVPHQCLVDGWLHFQIA